MLHIGHNQKTWYTYSFNPCIIYDAFSTWDFVLHVFCDIFRECTPTCLCCLECSPQSVMH